VIEALVEAFRKGMDPAQADEVAGFFTERALDFAAGGD
jgi:hypothetical protein